MLPEKLLALAFALALGLVALLGAACDEQVDAVPAPADRGDVGPAGHNPNLPAAPTGLAATIISPFQIDLSWNDNSTNETGFKVYQKKGSGNWSLIIALPAGSLSLSATGLLQNKKYSFKVVAYNSFGKAASNIAVATTPIPVPAAPGSLAATAISDIRVILTWTDNSTDETGFRIERKTGAAGAWHEIGLAPANATAFADTTVAASTEYYYRVAAYNTGGNSAWSNEAGATTPAPPPPPAAPTGLGVNVISSSQVNLNWTDNSSNEAGFRIERKTGAAGTFVQVASVGAGVVSYSNTGLSASTDYYYRVRAYNSGGNSIYTNEAEAITLADTSKPKAPTGLAAAVAGPGYRINLTWLDKSGNEDGFLIERKTGSTGVYAQVAMVGANLGGYTNTGLASRTQYYYRVLAFNAYGESAYSNEATAATASPPGTNLRLTSAAGSSLNPVVAWSGSEYGVAWCDTRDGDTAVYFSRLSPDGVKPTAELRVTTTGSPRDPSLCWNGSEFGLAWDDNRNGNREIYFCRIAAGGSKQGADLRITSAAGDSFATSLAWTGSQFGMSWFDLRNGGNDIFFARLGSTGVKQGADVRVTIFSTDAMAPSLAWTGSQFGVSWHDQLNGIAEVFFTRISDAGVKLGSDVRLTSFGVGSRFPSLTWTGSQFGVSWADDRNGDSEIYFCRVSAAGSKQGADVRLTSATGDSTHPQLSWTGSEFGVVWEDSRGSGPEIYFATVSATGSKSGTDLRVTGGLGASTAPALVWSGSEFASVWTDARDGNDEVYFARIPW